MKKYILIMGLMTCMCLMATSCKSEDEDVWLLDCVWSEGRQLCDDM